jgi:hypothetical protein
MHIRAALCLVLLTIARPLAAQAPGVRPPEDDSELRLTIFRNPATGLEYRRAHLAVFVGFYPTVLRLNPSDEQKNTNWIRVGMTYYVQPTGRTMYATVSGVFSLQSGWRDGLLTEIGGRLPFGDRVAGRLGAAVLTTLDGRVRVNPTVGLDVRLTDRR